jgi:hypothetical protein
VLLVTERCHLDFRILFTTTAKTPICTLTLCSQRSCDVAKSKRFCRRMAVSPKRRVWRGKLLALVRTSGWVLLEGMESASVRKETRTFIRSSTSNKLFSRSLVVV